MGAAFRHFVDLDRGDALFGEVALGSRGRQYLESQSGEQPGGFEDARLVGILDRDEDGTGFRQPRAAAELAFDEGDVVVPRDAHDLAGRFHLRAEHGIDRRPKPREREYRLLDADMFGGAWREILR